jgi:translation elongation factor EF-Ts
MCKALVEAGIILGKESLNEGLEALWNTGGTILDQPIKALIDIIYDKFTARKNVLKKEGKELSVANYVKNRTDISKLLEVAITKTVSKGFAAALRTQMDD